MSETITRCPACKTSFRITEDQLLAAEGSVRCGTCQLVFQAEDYFVSPMMDRTELLAIEADYWRDFESYVEQVADAPPESDMVDLSSEEHSYEVSLWTPVSLPTGGVREGGPVGFWQPYRPRLSGLVSITEPEEAVESQSVSADPIQHWLPEAEEERPSTLYLDEDLQEMPDLDLDVEPDTDALLADRRRSISFAGLKWLPGIAVMILIAAAQYAYFNMQTYAQDLRYRDYFLTACRYLQCEVPDYADLGQLLTRELVIRTHPDRPDALVCDVLLRNAGNYRQQFPGLRLRFFDIRGDIVASRTFRVGEYLGGEMRGLRYIPASTEVRLSLELIDPGEHAMSYEMDVIRM